MYTIQYIHTLGTIDLRYLDIKLIYGIKLNDILFRFGVI